ncbi:MAG: hypothetical protein ACLP9L_28295 [Thermoguttaceae bacterium]
MTRRFTLIGLSMACVLFLAASAAPAAEDVFKLVPDSALGLLVINRPAAADAKFQALGRRMQLPVPGLLAMLKQHSGVQEGWDESGTIALLVLPPQGDSALPTPILLVPVTDYGKFLGSLKAEDATQPVTKIEIAQTSHWVRNIGGYAALTDASHRQALEKKWTPSKESPAALVPWRKWLKGKDFAGVILRPGIVQISVKAQQGIQAMKTVVAAMPNEQAKAVAGAFDIYTKMFQAAEKDVSAFGFGLQLDEQDVLRLTSRTTLMSGGLMAQSPPADENHLGGLPAGPFVAAGGAAISAPMTEAMMKWSIDMMKAAPGLYGIDEEQAKNLSALSMESMKGVRGFSMMLGRVEQGGAIFSNAIGVMRVDRAPAFMAEYEKDLHKYAELVNGLHSPMLPPIEIEKSEVGGTAALQLTMQAPKPLVGGQALQQKRMMELFFGPGDKVVAWVAPADEHHVVLGYVSKKPVQRAMEAIRQGNKPSLAGDIGVAKTAALLPSGAMAAVYLNPTEMIRFVQQMATGITPPEAKVKLKLPEFPKTPPIGFAVTTAADEVQTCLVVPAEVLQAIGPYVGQIKAMQSDAAR